MVLEVITLKKTLEVEELLEEKIRNYKLLADVNLTFTLLKMEDESSSTRKLRYPKDCCDSVLLESVAHCHPQQLKKYNKTLSTTLITDKDNAQILEKISIWENKVNFNDVFHQYISSMWELPEIGNFVAILFKNLDLDIINQGEIERMFLMPKESTTMAKIMTTLLMPVKKIKSISGQVMPYKVWSKKLSKKVSDWFKVYYTKKQNKVIVMNSLGIHPDFWSVVNEKNPLIEKDYSELSYNIKVWLVKGLCDYVTIKFKTINDIVTNCNERQCTIWKNALETEEYFFFNSMPDLRIYYYNIPYDEPCLEFLESVKTVKQVVQFEDNLTLNRFSKVFHTIPKEKNFKLIADSVEGLRSFVRELNVKGTSVPENLVNSLKNLIEKIELEENNYIAMNNASRIKLFKDWISYPDRIQRDEDNMTVWEEKDSKAIAQGKNEGLIIVEKRQRKLRVPLNVDTVDSDEYISENDKSLSDFTDSEDEWGALNQPKKKVKQPQQTHSKTFLKLENRVLEAEKMLKYSTNQSDEKRLRYEVRISKPSTNEVCKTKKKNKSIKSVELLKTQNDVKFGSTTNTILNSHNKVKSLQLTPSKGIKLEKRLREKDTTLRHGSVKVFKSNKKDKSMKSVQLLKTQNEVKFSNNTNKFVNVNKQRSVCSKNKDNVCSYEEVVLIGSNKEENQKSFDGLRQVEVITLDEDMQNNCKVFDDNFESSVSTCTEDKHRKTNEQYYNKYTKRIESAVISIEDDDQIIISDHKHDVQLLSMPVKPVCSSLKTNKPCSSKTNNSNKSIKSVELLKTQNEVKCGSTTNTILNSHNKVKSLQLTPSKGIKLEKRLREKDTTLKHGSVKVFKYNKKDKSIKSHKLLKTQNEVKCSNTTNTILNSHYKVKPLQLTPSKCIKLEKRLREEDTTLKHGSVKVFKSNKKDKSMKSVQLLKTQNEVKFSNNTNKFVNVNKQRSVRSKNKDNVCSYEEVVLIGSNKEENQKSFDGLRQVEVITLDEDIQNNCKVFDDNFESSVSTCTEDKHRKTNEQYYNKYTKRIESAVISIEDDDQIIISDHKYDVQLLSMPVKPVCSSLKTNEACSLKTYDSNKSYNSVSANRQITNTNYITNQETSSIIHNLSQSVTIIPANVNIPKDIVVTMVKAPQMDSNFNSIKRKSTTLNGHLSNNSSIINVKCELISKPNLNEEVKFYVRLPNGTERPVSNEIINRYLKQHNNQLPDFWLVPLAVEDVKQYGVN